MIIDVAFQTINQKFVVHFELIFFLTKKMKIFNKNFIILFKNIVKINNDVFLFVRIFTTISKFFEIFFDVHQNANIVFSILIHEIVSFFFDDQTKFDVNDFDNVDKISIVIRVHTMNEILFSKIQLISIFFIFFNVEKLFEFEKNDEKKHEH